MRIHRAAAWAAVTLTLAGCANNQQSGTLVGAVAGGALGSAFGKGGGKIAAIMVGTVVGGVIGSEIGRKMDEDDRRLASRAEYDALDHGDPGRPIRWDNPHNHRYGEVVPGPYYEREYRRCRDYTHTVYIDGQPQAMRGTACRNPDGTWSAVG